jgi:hypothetical protein
MSLFMLILEKPITKIANVEASSKSPKPTLERRSHTNPKNLGKVRKIKNPLIDRGFGI